MTEDLGINELKVNPPYPPLGKGANKGSFCKGAGAKRLRIFNQDILRPSTEILGETLTTNAQNDMEGNTVIEHSYSSSARVSSQLDKKNSPEFLNSLTFIKKFFPQHSASLRYTSSHKKFEILKLIQNAKFFGSFCIPQGARGFQPAFTLAEVLITLGVIGIVAAMTMPTLISKHREKVTVNQLKKVYSELSQAFELSVANSGYEPRHWTSSSASDPSAHQDVANQFVPYLSLMYNCVGYEDSESVRKCAYKVKGYSSFLDPKYYAWVRLSSGASVGFRLYNKDCNSVYGTSQQLKNVCGTITVDINGSKMPNFTGTDIFLFYITNYGIVPMGSRFDTRVKFSTHCNNEVEWGIIHNDYTNGSGCTAWVLENENMDYKYCNKLDWDKKTNCKQK